MKLKLKLIGGLALLLTAVCGLSSCSLFGFGDKKKPKPRRSSEPTFAPGNSPMLGSDGPNLGTSKERH